MEIRSHLSNENDSPSNAIEKDKNIDHICLETISIDHPLQTDILNPLKSIFRLPNECIFSLIIVNSRRDVIFGHLNREISSNSFFFVKIFFY